MLKRASFFTRSRLDILKRQTMKPASALSGINYTAVQPIDLLSGLTGAHSYTTVSWPSMASCWLSIGRTGVTILVFLIIEQANPVLLSRWSQGSQEQQKTASSNAQERVNSLLAPQLLLLQVWWPRAESGWEGPAKAGDPKGPHYLTFYVSPSLC